jgi:ribosomal protein S18 acetylase RimI-like enzyme
MSTAELFIRPASREDADILTELGIRTFRDTFGPDNDPQDLQAYLASAFTPPQIAAELADPAVTFLLAYAAVKPIGYAKLMSGKVPESVQGCKPIELVRLYVEKGVIGKGCGAALMTACIEAARKSGYETLWLGVWERNAYAQNFYRKWGFRQVGFKEFIVGTDVQKDLIMERRLKP